MGLGVWKMDELKPCPCGCDLLFGYDVDYGGEFDSQEEAVEAWNQRAAYSQSQ